MPGSKVPLSLSHDDCATLSIAYKLTQPQVRFLHKRFLCFNACGNGFLNEDDFAVDRKHTSLNPWFCAFVERLFGRFGDQFSNFKGFLEVSSKFLGNIAPDRSVEERLAAFLAVLCTDAGDGAPAIGVDGITKLLAIVSPNANPQEQRESALALVRRAADDTKAAQVSPPKLAAFLAERLPNLDALLHFDFDPVESAQTNAWEGVTQADPSDSDAAT